MTLHKIIDPSQKKIIGTPNSFAKKYEQALEMFWNGDAQDTIKFVSQQIEATSGVDSFPFYRLWIEQASVSGEMDTLQRLKNHLVVRSYESPQYNTTWQALRGLIHLELDEIQAVKLIARALGRSMDNPYCMELTQKINFRSSLENDYELSLLKCQQPIEDYFHWQTIARSLLDQDRTSELHRLNKHVSNIFPGSPLSDEYAFQESVDFGRFSEAQNLATSLASRFPKNSDYKFWAGYSHFQSGEFSRAIEELNSSNLESQQDPDFLIFLAMSYDKSANGDVGNPDHSKALEYYRLAEKAAQENNLPCIDIRLSVERMVAEQQDYMNVEVGEEDVHASKAWLVKLTPQQYYSMQTGSDEEISSMRRPLGDQANPGDFVFFAAEDPMNSDGRWRIVSIYTVASMPAWNPMTRFESELELVYRMEFHLEVDVKIGDADQKLQVPASHPINFGVYSLEGGALDVITEAVQRRNEENQNHEYSGMLEETISLFKKSS